MNFWTDRRFHVAVAAVGYVLLATILAAAALGYVFRQRAAPWLVARLALGEVGAGQVHDHGHGAGHQHETNSLQLSPQAQGHLGLKPIQIKLEPYERTISIPGIVVARPGRCEVVVTAPMAGIVTNILITEGEAVSPARVIEGQVQEAGQHLFDMRLSHEELVQVQGEFLTNLEQLDVINQEIQRLENSTVKVKGEELLPIAGKTLLAQRYEQQKVQAALRAQRQRLELHGLTKEQVAEIEKKPRALRRDLQVSAPPNPNDPSRVDPRHVLRVANLRVRPGQHVEAGEALATLVDYSELLIEGRAFEKDALAIAQAIQAGWKVTALLESQPGQPQEALEILYLSDQINRESRAFAFYVRLPNELLRPAEQTKSKKDRSGNGGPTPPRPIIGWRYKPGQRVDLLVPVEKWTDRIVLPIDAVVQDGVEWYVFVQNGDHFDRRPVHVQYKDQRFAVIANDGSIVPKVDTVAGSGAYQMLLALKNKAGGGVDPHAGHSH
jgi:cobalt-zinc-cadmium efflux system membrane fusion protein